ncbi:protein translocase subunit SecF [Fundidesulfovibrio butyratiphilus]
MGFELIKPGINIDFMRFRKIAYCFSILLVLAGVVSLVAKGGPRYGVDFAGGMTIQVKFTAPVAPQKIKAPLDEAGLPNLVVQRLGQEKDNTFLIRASEHGDALDTMRSTVDTALRKAFGDKNYDVQRVEMVGPKVGADLRAGALNAVYYAVLLIAIYISGRFEQRWLAAGAMAGGLWTCSWALAKLGVPTAYLILAALAVTLLLCWALKLKFALGAVLADIHDIMITVGIFSLFNIEFDLTIVAALLTILGYSLNDTIIVYDRIRENFRHGDGKPMAQVINEAVNQTLSRTLLVSGTSLLAVVCLFLFGGSVMRDFSLAMIIGIVTGTYSSIFVASPILVDLGTGLDALNRSQPDAAEGSAA